METVFFILAKTISVFLSLVSVAMMVRVIMPFFFEVEENKLFMLSCLISEPLITPVRAIMAKLNIGQDSPIDWAFFVTFFIVSLLETVLPVI